MDKKTIRSLLSPKGSYNSNDMEHYTQLGAGKIAAALKTKDPVHYMPLFYLIEDKDTSVGSEVEKRVSSVENKFYTHALDKKYNDSVEEIIKAAIQAKIYGVAIVELYINSDGDFAYALVPKEYYYFEFKKILLQKGKTKFEPKEPNFFIIKSKPVLLKVLWLVYAKHFVLSHYLKFAEFLGVPPLIVNAHSSDSDVIDGISAAVKQIKSGDFAVLGAEDIVKVLEGRGNQSDFMEFVRYVDSEIAKTLNGASLGSNTSTTGGSYAQSKSHEDNRAEITRSDVRFATKIANLFFKHIGMRLELNIQVEKDVDLKARAETLQILKGMGYDMTPEQIAYEFDLPAPFKKEANKKSLSTNSKDLADVILEDTSFNDSLQEAEEEMFKTIEKLSRESESYEELYEKLSLHYKDMEFIKLDELMLQAITANTIKGALDE
ncbi:MAG: DUF935 family protein [Sulfurospirillum sp.]|nr:DUF935 family protein [Sulfurospirillum sp.]